MMQFMGIGRDSIAFSEDHEASYAVTRRTVSSNAFDDNIAWSVGFEDTCSDCFSGHYCSTRYGWE